MMHLLGKLPMPLSYLHRETYARYLLCCCNLFATDIKLNYSQAGFCSGTLVRLTTSGNGNVKVNTVTSVLLHTGWQ